VLAYFGPRYAVESSLDHRTTYAIYPSHQRLKSPTPLKLRRSRRGFRTIPGRRIGKSIAVRRARPWALAPSTNVRRSRLLWPRIRPDLCAVDRGLRAVRSELARWRERDLERLGSPREKPHTIARLHTRLTGSAIPFGHRGRLFSRDGPSVRCPGWGVAETCRRRSRWRRSAPTMASSPLLLLEQDVGAAVVVVVADPHYMPELGPWFADAGRHRSRWYRSAPESVPYPGARGPPF